MRNIHHQFLRKISIASSCTGTILGLVNSAFIFLAPSTPLSVLKQFFGYDQFRLGQAEAIDAILNHQDCLILMPTGGGKSLCYQIPALLFDGVTIVITPLLSLMKDQVDQLQAMGIAANFINSQQTKDEQQSVMEQLQAGQIKLLYVAPERLLQYQFLSQLRSLNLAMFAVDEAHCVSHWGHDFRQDYLKLGQLKQYFPTVPIMALTATADKATRADIAQQLNLNQPFTFIGNFDRPNLRYTIEEKFKPLTQLLRFISSQDDQPGIVYCSSRARVDDVAAKLQQKGINAAAYHAGMEMSQRIAVQDRFVRDQVQIVVATIAFGMGINKSNIRFVVHYDLPKTIENYYQETGRAGRDGLPSECVMLFDPADIAFVKRLISQNPNEQRMQVEMQRFNAMAALADGQTCRRQVLLNYFNQYQADGCGNCDICLDPPTMFDGTELAQKALSCIYRAGQQFGIGHIVEVLRGSQNQRVKELNHDQLSTYGIGRDHAHEYWVSIIRQLIHLGLVEQDIAHNSRLTLNDACRSYLRGESSLTLAVPRISGTHTYERAVKVNYDKKLFARLKALRKAIAEQHDIPPFVVFSDATLADMAAKLPTTPRALLMVSGVGEIKLERYGEAFLAVIERHLHDDN